MIRNTSPSLRSSTTKTKREQNLKISKKDKDGDCDMYIGVQFRQLNDANSLRTAVTAALLQRAAERKTLPASWVGQSKGSDQVSKQNQLTRQKEGDVPFAC